MTKLDNDVLSRVFLGDVPAIWPGPPDGKTHKLFVYEARAAAKARAKAMAELHPEIPDPADDVRPEDRTPRRRKK